MTTSAPRPSTPALRLAAHAWWLVLAGTLGLLVWANQLRIARVNYVTGSACWSVDAPAEDPRSPTGYADGQRRLIVPGHHNASYRVIMQAQQLLVRGDWRARHADHDNAPAGRVSHATLPYRCWLALVSWFDHLVSGRSLPLAVEHAALLADPLLHGLLVIGVTCFCARHFGSLAASVAAVALVTLLPLAGSFQPGAPDEHSLSWVCAVWGVLPLLAGIRGPGASTPGRGLFVLAGIAGGLGLWNDWTSGWPIVAGVGLGAGLSILLARRGSVPSETGASPWRWWASAGAITGLAGYLLEYLPALPEWTVQSIHPLAVVAWLGLGELLARLSVWRTSGLSVWNRRSVTAAALALVALAALPTAMLLTQDSRFFADDPFTAELANMPNTAIAPGTVAWLRRDGASPLFWAAGLPVLFVAAAGGLLASRRVPPAQQQMLALALGPFVVVVTLAWGQLRWWNALDAACLGALLALLTTVAGPETSPVKRGLWAAALLLLLLPGGLLLSPPAGARAGDPLNGTEVQAVVERDVAYWLVRQSGPVPPVIFSTPILTETLIYYGGMKGLVTTAWENKDGFSAAVRIASASTTGEMQTLLTSREITHLVLPSWDATLEQFVRIGLRVPDGTVTPASTLVGALQGWRLPPWLRAMTYHLPNESAFQDLGLAVFTLQGEQDEALAACRLADYFVEMGLLDQARTMRDQLALYPRNLAALATLAQVDAAVGDADGYQKTLTTLQPYLTRRSAKALPFDRRISLAVLLVQTKQTDAAREQMQQCLAEMTLPRVRELTTGALVRLFALSGLLGLELPDPQLREQALSLLPPTLRARVEQSAKPKG